MLPHEHPLPVASIGAVTGRVYRKSTIYSIRFFLYSSQLTIMDIIGTVEEFKTPSVITDYSGTITGSNDMSDSRNHWTPDNNRKQINFFYPGFEGAWALGRFTNAVNLTGWNYIDFKISTSRQTPEGYFGISQTPNLSSISLTKMIKVGQNITGQNYKLDVSSNNGVWYLYIAGKNPYYGGASQNIVTVSDVKLMTQ